MPRGARVISLTGMPCSEYWPLLRNGHLGAMVIVRRDGFSNDQWLLEGVNLLDLKYRAAGYFAADPSQLVRPNRCRDPLHRTIDESLAALPRGDFDYVWLIDVPPYDPRLVAGCSRSGADRDPCSIDCTDASALDRRSLLQRGSVPALLHERLGAAARAAVGEDYEIVLVNDGSRDGSWAIMQQMAADDRTSSRSTCRATTATSSR